MMRHSDSENTSNKPGLSENQIIIKLVADQPLVWTAEEWLELQKHRIFGVLIGVPANLDRQNVENGLPLLLHPEEVTFILEKKLGKLFKYKTIEKFPREDQKNLFEKYLSENKEGQVKYYRELCRGQVVEKIDSIIEGKRRKLMAKKKTSKPDESSSIGEEAKELDRDQLVETEVERRLSAATSSLLEEIPTVSPLISLEDLEVADWKYPRTGEERLKYSVFKDLHTRGYWLTSGSKFGGDFLAYPGEPWKFHAFFVVKCYELSEELPCLELIRHARLGVFARKNFLMASLGDDNSVLYTTISWPSTRGD